MKSITENLINEFIEQKGVLMFWASWCGPCIETDYLELFEKESNIPVGRINVEENPNVLLKYSIKILPTYILFDQKRPKKTLLGLQSKDILTLEFK